MRLAIDILSNGGKSFMCQVAERSGNRASNQKVDGPIPNLEKLPWARHFTLFASGRMSLYLLYVALDKSVC